jgi:long-subunit fatty acid transport protein
MGWSITGNLTYTDWSTGGYRYFKFTSGSGTVSFNYTP